MNPNWSDTLKAMREARSAAMGRPLLMSDFLPAEWGHAALDGEPRDDSPGRGPGTELKALLAGWPFYITSSPDCSCNAMADRMDAMGPDWCASPEGMQEILEAMKKNAAAKSIPYVELAAKMLVRRAIRIARGKNKPILP